MRQGAMPAGLVNAIADSADVEQRALEAAQKIAKLSARSRAGDPPADARLAGRASSPASTWKPISSVSACNRRKRKRHSRRSSREDVTASRHQPVSGFNPASTAARRFSRNGGSDNFSPEASSGSSARKARTVRCDLEQNAVRLAEIKRLEIKAIDLAAVRHFQVDQAPGPFVIFGAVRRASGDVMHAARTRLRPGHVWACRHVRFRRRTPAPIS